MLREVLFCVFGILSAVIRALSRIAEVRIRPEQMRIVSGIPPSRLIPSAVGSIFGIVIPLILPLHAALAAVIRTLRQIARRIRIKLRGVQLVKRLCRSDSISALLSADTAAMLREVLFCVFGILSAVIRTLRQIARRIRIKLRGVRLAKRLYRSDSISALLSTNICVLLRNILSGMTGILSIFAAATISISAAVRRNRTITACIRQILRNTGIRIDLRSFQIGNRLILLDSVCVAIDLRSFHILNRPIGFHAAALLPRILCCALILLTVCAAFSFRRYRTVAVSVLSA